ncbi:hypothetical protein NE237_030757 [Protea cynaroides]|uniref:BHLH domain-containing protein n=1 Tax=Protea cynaroides TaxID=273540 RepID=A0A9Q0GUU2_9MAGN|nr:hypothetical protein NE237_030757 [Protea cynaroides]
MCWAMATGLQNQEGVPDNHLRKQLAFAVRSIQWSYAIFWSISTRGVLEWRDGYYNGDIKTRKTLQPREFNADQMGLQRSEQLRELYESLSAGDTNPQARRPSASLSPEDLTDAEWYYMVCMSFQFSRGQGLPGRALENGKPIWLYRAPDADSKVFTRSLLAKSASIETIVCFPFLGGVVELGVTDLVSEDPKLIQQVKTCCLEFPRPNCIEPSASSPQNADNEEDPACARVGHGNFDTMDIDPEIEFETKQESATPALLSSYIPLKEIEFNHDRIEEFHANICQELEAGSPQDSSNGCRVHQHTGDSIMLEGVNREASQVQSWQFLDDEFSHCVLGSMNSSDCISQTLGNPQNVLPSPKGEKIKNLHLQDLQELQECNDTKLGSLGLGTDDLHYSRTLSSIFKDSHRLIVAPCFRSGNPKSSFTNWRRLADPQKTQIGTPQKILKKMLFEVAWMHDSNLIKSVQRSGKDGLREPEGDDVGVNHVLSERRRREKLKEKFHILKSLVPSVGKVDKASILGDTIEYLKELESRVEELESCREVAEYEARARKKHPDIAERTSDNYVHREITNSRKTAINKRKASDIDQTELLLNWDSSSKDGLAANYTVVMNGKEVLIEIRCPWRESLLLNIMDAISNLSLDAYMVQSSTVNGILKLTIKSKSRGVAAASAGMIKQTLQRIMGLSM